MNKKIFILLGIVLIFLSGCTDIDKPVSLTDNSEIIFEIPAGASTKGIAQLLYEENIINNKNHFKKLSKDMGADGKMQAGTYSVSRSMTKSELINKFVAGDVYVKTVKFTIPEGFEVYRIADYLESLNLIDKQKFYNSLDSDEFDNEFLKDVDRNYHLEGYLFPDTYEVALGSSEHDIIQMLLNRFDRFYTDDVKQKIKNTGLTLDEFVTMASIVERETVLDEERPLVASVFYNRLNRGMLFQSCATVQYVLQERKDVLSYDDIAINSDYNTYKNVGLPPSAIANAGEKSFMAVLNPSDTEYLYFRRSVKRDGSQIFSKTLKEHEAASNK